MKIILQEDQTPFENEESNNGIQFTCIGGDVFVQIGDLSIRVERHELYKVVTLLS